MGNQITSEAEQKKLEKLKERNEKINSLLNKISKGEVAAVDFNNIDDIADESETIVDTLSKAIPNYYSDDALGKLNLSDQEKVLAVFIRVAENKKLNTNTNKFESCKNGNFINSNGKFNETIKTIRAKFKESKLADVSKKIEAGNIKQKGIEELNIKEYITDLSDQEKDNLRDKVVKSIEKYANKEVQNKVENIKLLQTVIRNFGDTEDQRINQAISDLVKFYNQDKVEAQKKELAGLGLSGDIIDDDPELKKLQEAAFKANEKKLENQNKTEEDDRIRKLEEENKNLKNQLAQQPPQPQPTEENDKDAQIAALEKKIKELESKQPEPKKETDENINHGDNEVQIADLKNQLEKSQKLNKQLQEQNENLNQQIKNHSENNGKITGPVKENENKGTEENKTQLEPSFLIKILLCLPIISLFTVLFGFNKTKKPMQVVKGANEKYNNSKDKKEPSKNGQEIK